MKGGQIDPLPEKTTLKKPLDEIIHFKISYTLFYKSMGFSLEAESSYFSTVTQPQSVLALFLFEISIIY